MRGAFFRADPAPPATYPAAGGKRNLRGQLDHKFKIVIHGRLVGRVQIEIHSPITQIPGIRWYFAVSNDYSEGCTYPEALASTPIVRHCRILSHTCRFKIRLSALISNLRQINAESARLASAREGVVNCMSPVVWLFDTYIIKSGVARENITRASCFLWPWLRRVSSMTRRVPCNVTRCTVQGRSLCGETDTYAPRIMLGVDLAVDFRKTRNARPRSPVPRSRRLLGSGTGVASIV